MRTSGFGDSFETSTIGVLPIMSSTFSLTAVIESTTLSSSKLENRQSRSIYSTIVPTSVYGDYSSPVTASAPTTIWDVSLPRTDMGRQPPGNRDQDVPDPAHQRTVIGSSVTVPSTIV